MDIPAPWTAVLATIQQYAPEAVMAGGCLRDLDNGRPVKDIDIFVRGAGLDSLRDLHRRLSEAGHHVEDIDDKKLYPLGDGNDVVGCIDMLTEGPDEPVQIIMVNHDCSPAAIVDRFDYGICRIVFDGKELFRAAEYSLDQHNQVFKLRRQRTDLELAASVHRYARLVRKYEGWSFVPFGDIDFVFEDCPS